MLQDEGDAFDRLFLLPYRAGCQDAGAAEELLGQAPVLGGAPSADASRAEQLRHDDPRVFEHLFLPECRDRHRRIEPPAQSPHPALAVPACKQPGSGLTLDPQDAADIVNGHDLPRVTQHLTELNATFGHGRNGSL